MWNAHGAKSPEILALVMAHSLCRLTKLLMTMQTRTPRMKLPLMSTHHPVSFVDIHLGLTTFAFIKLSSMPQEDHLDECSFS